MRVNNPPPVDGVSVDEPEDVGRRRVNEVRESSGRLPPKA